MMDGPVRVRVAPSPTGDPHVGTAYQALFNYAFARQRGGHFILRIEDTDRARSTPESEQAILDSLHWLGLSWDEGPDVGGQHAPYRQSERTEIYRDHVRRLLEAGHAYRCFCTRERLDQMRAENRDKKAFPGYDRRCRNIPADESSRRAAEGEVFVVRMKVPVSGECVMHDYLRGEIHKEWELVDDQVILKSDGFPTYHLANVVDDHLMGITHVVRGEEWISSTPKHVLLYRWLGLPEPAFAHMPLLRNEDKSKISKRKNPAARLTWFVEQGYLPEALVNFLALLGYGQPGESEVFTFEQFSETFDWARVNTVGPVFDLKKLGWLNGHYIRALGPNDFAERLVEFAAHSGELGKDAAVLLRAAAPLVQERTETLLEGLDMLRFLTVDDADFAVDEAAAAKQLGPEQQPTIAAAAEALQPLAQWDAATIEQALRTSLVDGLGLKPKFAFGPVRVAVTGRQVSPPLFESMEILGRERSLARLAAARS